MGSNDQLGDGTDQWAAFWEWYGTRFVWAVWGNDYCPFCEGDLMASNLFMVHSIPLVVLGAAGYYEYIPQPLIGLGVPFVLIGIWAARGFWRDLHGFQADRKKMAEDLADEHDAELERIG